MAQYACEKLLVCVHTCMHVIVYLCGVPGARGVENAALSTW